MLTDGDRLRLVAGHGLRPGVQETVAGLRPGRRQPGQRRGAHRACRRAGRPRDGRARIPGAALADAGRALARVRPARQHQSGRRRDRADVRRGLGARRGRARAAHRLRRSVRASRAAGAGCRRGSQTRLGTGVPGRRVARTVEQPRLRVDAGERREPVRAGAGRLVRRRHRDRRRPQHLGRGARRPGQGAVGVGAAGALPDRLRVGDRCRQCLSHRAQRVLPRDHRRDARCRRARRGAPAPVARAEPARGDRHPDPGTGLDARAC